MRAMVNGIKKGEWIDRDFMVYPFVACACVNEKEHTSEAYVQEFELCVK